MRIAEAASRRWAYVGIAGGATISIYANVAEKYVRYDAVSRRWVDNPHPRLDGIILAASAPVILFLMSELLTAVRGSGGAAWTVRGASVVVALVAFVASFQHLHGLLLARDESDLTSWLYPLAVDGLMVGATAVLWQIRQQLAPAFADVLAELDDGSADQDGTELVPAAPSVPPQEPDPSLAPTPARRRPARPATPKPGPPTQDGGPGRGRPAMDEEILALFAEQGVTGRGAAKTALQQAEIACSSARLQELLRQHKDAGDGRPALHAVAK